MAIFAPLRLKIYGNGSFLLRLFSVSHSALKLMMGLVDYLNYLYCGYIKRSVANLSGNAW